MRAIFSALFVLLPTAAFAHTGHGDVSGFLHGFMHPVGGIDHILAMVAVGVFAFVLGGDSEAAPWIFVIGLVVTFITLCVAVVYGVLALFMGSGWLLSRGLFWLFVGGGMAGMAAWKAERTNAPSPAATNPASSGRR